MRAPRTPEELRDLAESDLITFARLVNPKRVYSEVHEKVFRWLQKENEDKTELDFELNQLVLLPRAHQKSHMLAVWAAWWITKHPATTILYISATATLAEQQLYAIKGMMDSKVYKRYWPEMLDPDEGKREKWSATGISVDHQKRREEGVRDFTVATAGLTTNTTGWHADVVLADDVVVPDNAYTEEGRRKTAAAMSQMSSIKNAGGMIKAVGTRYHPADQYAIWKNQKEFIYDLDDNVIAEQQIWDIWEEVVEVDGVFLWPREARSDGKQFGFNRKVLARVYAEYEDKTQFHAQYYNNPNDPESQRISQTKFQYYDQKYIKNHNGRWYFKDRPMNVVAAIDFAFSLSKRADYTALVVVGIDTHGDIYVLDIERFKTDKISELQESIVHAHNKWDFRKIRAEVNASQGMIVRDLKQRFKEDGISIKVDTHAPSRHEGTKEERIRANLEVKYDNQIVWHYKGGYIPMLEEELILARPPHDDIKDALASAVEILIKPQSKIGRTRGNVVSIKPNSRFGGMGVTMSN